MEGRTHEQKSATTTTVEVVVLKGADGIKETVLLWETLSVLVTLRIALTLGRFYLLPSGKHFEQNACLSPAFFVILPTYVKFCH